MVLFCRLTRICWLNAGSPKVHHKTTAIVCHMMFEILEECAIVVDKSPSHQQTPPGNLQVERTHADRYLRQFRRVTGGFVHVRFWEIHPFGSPVEFLARTALRTRNQLHGPKRGFAEITVRATLNKHHTSPKQTSRYWPPVGPNRPQQNGLVPLL